MLIETIRETEVLKNTFLDFPSTESNTYTHKQKKQQMESSPWHGVAELDVTTEKQRKKVNSNWASKIP